MPVAALGDADHRSGTAVPARPGRVGRRCGDPPDRPGRGRHRAARRRRSPPGATAAWLSVASALAATAVEAVPLLAQLRLASRAWRTDLVPTDGLPVVGPVVGPALAEGLYRLGGLGTDPLALGPAAAEALAQHLVDEEPTVPLGVTVASARTAAGRRAPDLGRRRRRSEVIVLSCSWCGGRSESEFDLLAVNAPPGGEWSIERWWHRAGCGRPVVLARNLWWATPSPSNRPEPPRAASPRRANGRTAAGRRPGRRRLSAPGGGGTGRWRRRPRQPEATAPRSGPGGPGGPGGGIAGRRGQRAGRPGGASPAESTGGQGARLDAAAHPGAGCGSFPVFGGGSGADPGGLGPGGGRRRRGDGRSGAHPCHRRRAAGRHDAGWWRRAGRPGPDSPASSSPSLLPIAALPSTHAPSRPAAEGSVAEVGVGDSLTVTSTRRGLVGYRWPRPAPGSEGGLPPAVFSFNSVGSRRPAARPRGVRGHGSFPRPAPTVTATSPRPLRRPAGQPRPNPRRTSRWSPQLSSPGTPKRTRSEWDVRSRRAGVGVRGRRGGAGGPRRRRRPLPQSLASNGCPGHAPPDVHAGGRAGRVGVGGP